MFGIDPPALGWVRLLRDVCGLHVVHFRQLPGTASSDEEEKEIADALDENPVVIHSNLRPSEVRVWSVIDDLRHVRRWIGPFLCVVPDIRWASRVREEFEKQRVGTDSDRAHRLLHHPVLLGELLKTLSEMKDRFFGRRLWEAARNGCPHICLIDLLRESRDGAAPGGEQLADLLAAIDTQTFFPHDVANALDALRAESTPQRDQELAEKLRKILASYLEEKRVD